MTTPAPQTLTRVGHTPAHVRVAAALWLLLALGWAAVELGNLGDSRLSAVPTLVYAGIWVVAQGAFSVGMYRGRGWGALGSTVLALVSLFGGFIDPSGLYACYAAACTVGLVLTWRPDSVAQYVAVRNH